MLTIRRDGYIKATELRDILEAVVDEMVDQINAVNRVVRDQGKEIDRLRIDLQTERRLRLGSRPRTV